MSGKHKGGGRDRREGACLALTLLAAWLALPVPAGAGEASLPPDAGAPPGQATSVPLSLDVAGGLLGADLVIQYDPAVARADGLVLTPLSSGCVLTYNLDPPGFIRVSLYGALPLAGGGDLLSIDFTSVGPLNSETPLVISTAEVNESAIPVSAGHYCVQSQAGEVQGLALAQAAGITSLSWAVDPPAAAYNLYRAAQVDLGDLGVLASGITGTSATESDTPAPLFLYLVTAVNCRGEGSPGTDSQGGPRPLPAP